MDTTTKRHVIMGVTLGVWLAGGASAAALAHELNRALLTEGYASLQFPRPQHPLADRTAEELPLPRPVLGMPAMTVVGWAPRRAVPPAKAVEAPLPDIAKMSCAAPRPLDMGSGNVQICEPPPAPSTRR
jgi:hypothetical protein